MIEEGLPSMGNLVKQQRDAMVVSQVKTFDVMGTQIIDAMAVVPRELFVQEARKSVAYGDEVQPLAEGRFLLTPMSQARLIQALDIQPGQAILDVASASGYSSAIAAHLAGTVISLEEDADLVAQATAIFPTIDINNVVAMHGFHEHGLPDQGPFDGIMVNGSCQIFPQKLFDQLSVGGKLVYFSPVGSLARLIVVTKTELGKSELVVDEMFVPELPDFAAKQEFVF